MVLENKKKLCKKRFGRHKQYFFSTRVDIWNESGDKTISATGVEAFKAT